MFSSDSSRSSSSYFLYAFIVFLWLFVLVGGSLQKMKEKMNEKGDPVVEYQEIKSFSLHSDYSSRSFGSFTLGCGYISSNGGTEMNYYFYRRGQVGYILCSISADRVEIVETDDKPPGIEGIFKENGDIQIFENYIIYVPVGTIFEEYKVAL